VREYFWTWSETVTRTKKGKLRAAITELKMREVHLHRESLEPPRIFRRFPAEGVPAADAPALSSSSG
jgi:hypothetical protein